MSTRCSIIGSGITESTLVPKWGLSTQVHRNHNLEFASAICLLFHKTLGPLWHWLLLSSLHIEPTSRASKRIMDQFPNLPKTIGSSHNLVALGNLMLLISMGCMTCSTVMIAWQCDIRNRASIFISTIMLLTLGGYQWHLTKGSAVELFLVFMPLAVSIGFSLGLLLEDGHLLRNGLLLRDGPLSRDGTSIKRWTSIKTWIYIKRWTPQAHTRFLVDVEGSQAYLTPPTYHGHSRE